LIFININCWTLVTQLIKCIIIIWTHSSLSSYTVVMRMLYFKFWFNKSSSNVCLYRCINCRKTSSHSSLMLFLWTLTQSWPPSKSTILNSCFYLISHLCPHLVCQIHLHSWVVTKTIFRLCVIFIKTYLSLLILLSR